jgi:hypothetical protein
VYVWWARYAGAEGLAVLGTGGRPAVVGALAMLSEVTGASSLEVAGAIGPVLAATVGLAAGALVETALGPNRARSTVAAVLTGTFVCVLVAGYFSTLAFGALFLAALALLAVDLQNDPADRRARVIGGAAAMLTAAGLSHPLFVPLGVGVLAGSAIALVPAWRREASARIPVFRRGLARLVAAITAGGALTVAGLPILGGTGFEVDTSRDSALRRLGLGNQLLDSYQRKLRDDLSWYRAGVVFGAAAQAFLPSHRDEQRPWILMSIRTAGDHGRLFWGAMAAWLAVSAGGVLALALDLPVPGHRLTLFCLPLPLLGAVGLWRSSRNVRTSRARGWILGGGAALFAAVSWIQWADQGELIRPEAVWQARTAGLAMANQPPGTPLIAIIDLPANNPGIEVIRSANILRGGVPAGRVQDVYLFAGTVADFRAGRPTVEPGEEHDRLSADSWRRIRPLMGKSPVVLSLQALAPMAFRQMIVLPEVTARRETYRIGPGVVVLPGFTGREHGSPSRPLLGDRLTEIGAGPFSPWTPVWLGLSVLAGLFLIGAPWAQAIVGTEAILSRVWLWPAFGLGALSLASVATDLAGFRLSEGGGPIAVGLAVGGGLIALAAARWTRVGRGATRAGRPGD